MKQGLLGRKRLNELANITKFKWRFDRRSCNSNSSNCKLTRKKFGDFNGIQIHGLCVSAAVLYQLSYEDPYIGSRPIFWVHLNPRKKWNLEWRWCELRKYKFKWRYDRRSGNCKLSNCKLTQNFRTSSGFEPMASAFALQRSLPNEPWRPIHWEQANLTGERNKLNQFACSQCMGLHSSVGRALHC